MASCQLLCLAAVCFLSSVWAEQRKLAPGKAASQAPLVGQKENGEPLELRNRRNLEKSEEKQINFE